MADRAARAILLRREPAGWRQQYRHRDGGAFARGRLYAVHGEHRQHHQQFALSEAQLQLHRRLRAGRERHGHAAARSRASVGSGKKCGRTDRARQGQPGQAQPRLGRRRFDRAHVR